MQKERLTYRNPDHTHKNPEHASETDSIHPPYHPIRETSLLDFFILMGLSLALYLVRDGHSVLSLWCGGAAMMFICLFLGTYMNEGWFWDGKPVPFMAPQILVMAMFIILSAGVLQFGLTGETHAFLIFPILGLPVMAMGHLFLAVEPISARVSRIQKFNKAK